MAKVKIEKSVINSHVRKTNTKLRGVKRANKSLFETVRDAVLEMREDKKALSQFKANVDCDRSSVNKIIKISESEFVMNNLDNLPSSWAVLHKITTCVSPENIVELERAIGDKTISVSSTLKNVREFFSGLKDAGKDPVHSQDNREKSKHTSSSSQRVISFNESDFSEDEIAKVCFHLEALREFGFEINQISALPKAA